MNRIALLILIISTFSCETSSNKKVAVGVSTDSSDIQSINKDNFTGEFKTDTIILYEDRIKNVGLPFGKRDMLTELKKDFAGLTITKEIGLRDGPDFPLYSIKVGYEEICFFAMDSEDTLKLNDVYIKHPLIKDQYGLKVGDTYQKIKNVRDKEVKTYTDYHQHTYAYFKGSNITYEISGDVFLPDTVDFENLKFTEQQIKDWTIEYLIWRKVDD